MFSTQICSQEKNIGSLVEDKVISDMQYRGPHTQTCETKVSQYPTNSLSFKYMQT